MKLEKWDPDLRTLALRRSEGRLDLQPAFQRGLVWPMEKKARLIDTALRAWSIPPVHLIREPNGTLSVLDGQQRLAAFFDFLEDRFPVRDFKPADSDISRLAGLKFSALPREIRYRILDTRISAFEIFEFSPDEPYELFFRLNHPTGLTAAEKRNALAGETRAQVRALAEYALSVGWNKDLIGFSDARGSYDDVIARVCWYIEVGNLHARLSPSVMEDFYREPGGITKATFDTVRLCIGDVARASSEAPGPFKFNKATLVTWLVIAARGRMTDLRVSHALPHAIGLLEGARLGQSTNSARRGFVGLIDIYRNRASLRVSDVLSVVVRDAVAGFVLDFLLKDPHLHPATDDIEKFLHRHELDEVEGFEEEFIELVNSSKRWGLLK